MGAIVVVGGQFGDEGKGKVVAYLALKEDPEAAVRGGVGPNAGHTVEHKGRIYKLRMIPSALVNPKARLLIGPGVLIDPKVLLREVQEYDVGGRLGIDAQCGIIEDRHLEEDKRGHLAKSIGTTGTGTGPANASRALRTLRLAREVRELRPYLADIAQEVNEIMERGGRVLVEGTQGTFLSLYHGTYPHVTSKDVTASSICADVGIGPTKVDEVIVVFKAYITRVGGGPLEGELSMDEVVRRGWEELGTVTNRARRAAPFNVEMAKRAIRLNGATQLALTKLDSLYPEVRGATNWKGLSERARSFVKGLEEALGLPFTLLGTGPSTEEMVDLRRE